MYAPPAFIQEQIHLLPRFSHFVDGECHKLPRKKRAFKVSYNFIIFVQKYHKRTGFGRDNERLAASLLPPWRLTRGESLLQAPLTLFSWRPFATFPPVRGKSVGNCPASAWPLHPRHIHPSPPSPLPHFLTSQKPDLLLFAFRFKSIGPHYCLDIYICRLGCSINQ